MKKSAAVVKYEQALLHFGALRYRQAARLFSSALRGAVSAAARRVCLFNIALAQLRGAQPEAAVESLYKLLCDNGTEPELLRQSGWLLLDIAWKGERRAGSQNFIAAAKALISKCKQLPFAPILQCASLTILLFSPVTALALFRQQAQQSPSSLLNYILAASLTNSPELPRLQSQLERVQPHTASQQQLCHYLQQRVKKSIKIFCPDRQSFFKKNKQRENKLQRLKEMAVLMRIPKCSKQIPKKVLPAIPLQIRQRQRVISEQLLSKVRGSLFSTRKKSLKRVFKGRPLKIEEDKEEPVHQPTDKKEDQQQRSRNLSFEGEAQMKCTIKRAESVEQWDQKQSRTEMRSQEQPDDETHLKSTVNPQKEKIHSLVSAHLLESEDDSSWESQDEAEACVVLSRPISISKLAAWVKYDQVKELTQNDLARIRREYERVLAPRQRLKSDYVRAARSLKVPESKIDGEHGAAELERARVLVRQEQFEQALRVMESAGLGSRESRLLRGKCLKELGYLQLMEKVVLSALEEEDWEVYGLLGEWQAQQGLSLKGVDNLEKALSLRPNDLRLADLLAQGLIQVNTRKSLQQARVLLEKSILRHGPVRKLLLQLLTVLEKLEDAPFYLQLSRLHAKAGLQFQVHYAKALALSGKKSEALRLVRRICQEEAGQQQIFRLADILELCGEWESSVELLNRLGEQVPRNVQAQEKLAQTLARRDKRRAIGCLLGYARRASLSEPLLRQVLHMMVEAKDFKQAMAFLDRQAPHFPQPLVLSLCSGILYSQGEIGKCLRQLKKLEKLAARGRWQLGVDEFLRKANCLFEMSQWEQAEAMYQVARNQLSAKEVANFAAIKIARGHYSFASNLLEESIAKSNAPELLFNLGVLLVLRGRFLPAAECFDRALSEGCEADELLKYRAYCSLQLGKLKEARQLATFEKAQVL